jgi:glycosyltransferase involved in cell wall biosynthesis
MLWCVERRPDGHSRTLSVVVCAYNEAAYLPACLEALAAQSRPADTILVVNNGSTDQTAAIAKRHGVQVVDEPRRGLPRAREIGRLSASGDVLVYVDADCQPPPHWLARVERRFARNPGLVALTGPYRYYDWSGVGPALIRTYDLTLAPATHLLVHRLLRRGAIFYGGNFAVRAEALERVGGFDTSIEFHGEDTNIGRRLAAIGRVALCQECYLYTSARRYHVLGTRKVMGLYIRNFVSEIVRHRPADTDHVDVRK